VALAIVVPAGAGAAASSHSTPSGVAQAKRLVAAAEKPAIRFVAPGPRFNAARAKGKKLFYIDYSTSPVVAEWASVSTAQLKRFGVSVVHINGQASTAQFNQAMEEAIAQHAGAIMLMGIDPSSIAHEVAAAKKARIPVHRDLTSRRAFPSIPAWSAQRRSMASPSGESSPTGRSRNRTARRTSRSSRTRECSERPKR
jgi:ABC-type sugar transport system substrate-binding protein